VAAASNESAEAAQRRGTRAVEPVVFRGGASYEVQEDYNKYHGKEFQFTEMCIYGYDHSAYFWARVIGRLSCGGIARASHGQSTIIGHRNKARLMAWQESRSRKNGSSVRPAFVRLARNVGAGENRIIRGSPVLIAGREDGAAGAFL
jgi:hypothetical protein